MMVPAGTRYVVHIHFIIQNATVHSVRTAASSLYVVPEWTMYRPLKSTKSTRTVDF